jgi:hypothetical protein
MTENDVNSNASFSNVNDASLGDPMDDFIYGEPQALP